MSVAFCFGKNECLPSAPDPLLYTVVMKLTQGKVPMRDSERSLAAGWSSQLLCVTLHSADQWMVDLACT